MLLAPVASGPFWALYAWCGLSDMIDGTIARTLGKESDLGARLDSLSDLVFVASSALTLLPVIRLEAWLIVWVALIGVCKTATSSEQAS